MTVNDTTRAYPAHRQRTASDACSPPRTDSTGGSGRRIHRLLLGALTVVSSVGGVAHAAYIGGSAVQWQPLLLDVAGPPATETDDSPNPFLDVRLDVVFTAPSGDQTTVPGFFAGNGRGYGTGNVWRVRFAPDEPGTWRWRIRFLAGADIAVADAGALADATGIGEHGLTGDVVVAERDPNAPGLLADGRIDYVGEHYLKQADGDWWIKGGIDSPENFFGFAGFDNTLDQPGGAGTPSLLDGVHRYTSHIDDFRPGDPEFVSETTGVNSHGIVGAVNYLADQGINSIYFLPMNLGGDGRETYPFIGATGSEFDDTHYDISKLFQWNQVLDHMQRRGIASHLVLSETEIGNTEWLDGGTLGTERKLYFRELVARYAYLNGIKWNLGEESRYGPALESEFAAHLRSLDWAGHQVAVHTNADKPDARYVPLLGNTDFDSTSIQFYPVNADRFTETWRRRSADAGWKWVIDLDEVGPGGEGVNDRNMDAMRREVLYPVYFSGGNLEWYFGYHALPLGGDMQTEDFRTREPIYRWTRIAREFMQSQLPFERMEPNDDALAGGNADDQVFSAAGEVHALYLLDGEEGRTLSVASGDWELAWFDPRNGDFVGGRRTLSGERLELGTAPAAQTEDWVVLVRRIDAAPEPSPAPAPAPAPAPETAEPLEPIAPEPTPVDIEGGESGGDAPELGAATPSNDGGGALTWVLMLLAGAGLLQREGSSRLRPSPQDRAVREPISAAPVEATGLRDTARRLR